MMYVESNLCNMIFDVCAFVGFNSVGHQSNILCHQNKTKQKFSMFIGYELSNQQEEVASYWK